MFSADVGDVVNPLIHVLRVALWRQTVRSEIASQLVYLNVWEVFKATRYYEIRPVQARIRSTKIVDHVIGNRPGIRKDDLSRVRAIGSEELRLRLRRIEIRRSKPVIEE